MGGIKRRALIAGATAAGLAVGRPARAQTKPFQIGVIIPLSGPQAVFGKDLQIGAQIAVEQIVAQGGPQIELVFRDDKADATQSVAAARELERFQPDWR